MHDLFRGTRIQVFICNASCPGVSVQKRVISLANCMKHCPLPSS